MGYSGTLIVDTGNGGSVRTYVASPSCFSLSLFADYEEVASVSMCRDEIVRLRNSLNCLLEFDAEPGDASV